MKENLTDIEKRILELRQKKGYTVEETLAELKIKRTLFKEIVLKLENLGLYDKEKIQQAIKKRKTTLKNKDYNSRIKLSTEEEQYRKKSIDVMCRRYFDYNKTKHFNPVLVSKLQGLNKFSSYKTIYNTIIYQQQNLDYANTKVFSSDFQKISYMIAIIKNNLSKVYTEMKEKEKNAQNLTITDSLARELTKSRVTKPTKRLDMSSLLDD